MRRVRSEPSGSSHLDCCCVAPSTSSNFCEAFNNSQKTLRVTCQKAAEEVRRVILFVGLKILEAVARQAQKCQSITKAESSENLWVVQVLNVP